MEVMMERIKSFFINFREYYFDKRGKILSYGVISIILLSFCVCSYFIFINNEEEINEVSAVDEVIISEEDNSLESDGNKEEEIVKIFVDIKGEVKKPGVYEVGNGSRVIDVINKAGGLKKEANTRYVNLSKKVSDGDVIVIYSNNEINEAMKSNIIYVETPCVCEEVNDACLENIVSDDSNEKNNINNDNNNINDNVVNDKININTASVDELMKLKGIGEAKAKSIAEYRENNGLFSKIEDILNVSGISEKIYENIKDSITV